MLKEAEPSKTHIFYRTEKHAYVYVCIYAYIHTFFRSTSFFVKTTWDWEKGEVVVPQDHLPRRFFLSVGRLFATLRCGTKTPRTSRIQSRNRASKRHRACGPGRIGEFGARSGQKWPPFFLMVASVVHPSYSDGQILS